MAGADRCSGDDVVVWSVMPDSVFAWTPAPPLSLLPTPAALAAPAAAAAAAAVAPALLARSPAILSARSITCCMRRIQLVMSRADSDANSRDTGCARRRKGGQGVRGSRAWGSGDGARAGRGFQAGPRRTCVPLGAPSSHLHRRRSRREGKTGGVGEGEGTPCTHAHALTHTHTQTQTHVHAADLEAKVRAAHGRPRHGGAGQFVVLRLYVAPQ